jgi:hypothetical protein
LESFSEHNWQAARDAQHHDKQDDQSKREFHGRTEWSFQVDGELRESQLDDRNGLWPSPESQLGHAPLPPRPFGRFGSNVAVIANRFVGGF